MASSTLKIASIGLGVSGVVGGTSTGIYLLSKKETTPNSNQQEQKQQTVTTKTKSKITDLLAGKSVSLIDENQDDGEWSRVFGTFKREHVNKNPSGIWEITDWSSKKEESKGLPELKKLCKKNKEEEVESEESSIYQEVVKYCTKTVPSSGLG